MKIGILGGTFDPVHLGHVQLAQNARLQFSLDKVIFIPVFQPPHKQAAPPAASATDRLNMVRLAIEGMPFLEVSDCEIKRKGLSYTFDTIHELEKKYPEATFFLILGKDAFEGIDAWHHAAELKKKIRFLVADRGVCRSWAPGIENAERIKMPLCPISASGIREAIKRGQKVDDDLSPKVLEYIQIHNLYGKS